MPLTVPHRVLIAPSGFKECLSANAVADALAVGVRRVLPGVQLQTLPLVDGGEGSAVALAEATGGELVPVTVTGPVGEPVEAELALLGGPQSGTAFVEMAAAAGLRLVPRDRRDPGVTTTYGVGELVRTALDRGVRRIVVGCGDSGTSDGGAGLVEALGGRLLAADGRPLPPGGAALADLAELDLSGLDPRLADCDIDVACNIHNVLTGPRGVARVFGPQKGAGPDQVEHLDRGLSRWAEVLDQTCATELGRSGVDVRTGPGTGASGGLGAALAAVCGARLRPRFEVLLDEGLGGVDLDTALALADLVVTAEGSVDGQTPKGKVPAEVARRAKGYGLPVIAFAGSIGDQAGAVYDVGIDAVVGIVPVPMDLETAITQAQPLLGDAAERAFRLFLSGIAFAADVAAR